MSVQLHEITVPGGEPATLDGVTFASCGVEWERASVDGVFAGELKYDEQDECWRFCTSTQPDDWLVARCRAEARAKIVTAYRRKNETREPQPEEPQ